MKISLAPMSRDDRESVVDIFNYYVENSFSAYPEKKVPYEFFDTLWAMCQGYPAVTARDERGEVIGFALLRPYNLMPAFSRTAEITYFVRPGFTGQGIGRMFLDYLIEEGKKKGLAHILAGIASLNEGSLRFHRKNGFVECGRFVNIGQKQDKLFDVVYYQLTL